MEVLRRWEEVRATNWLTAAQKEELKNLEQEHILLINEEKAFELVPYYEIKDLQAENISAFSFTRNGESYVVYWHRTGSGKLTLPLSAADFQVVEELWQQPIPVSDGIPADKRRYVKSKLPVEQLIAAFQKAELKEG